MQALRLQAVPSSPTLHQRLDRAGSTCLTQRNTILLEESANLLRKIKAPLTGVSAGGKTDIPLDIDSAPFDNSGTRKEGVSRTYKGVDGYAPLFAYFGEEGYNVYCELREGSTHVQKGTAEALRKSIHYARRIHRDARILVRMDAGHDSAENLQVLEEERADTIIKVNLRRMSSAEWVEWATEHGRMKQPPEGKVVLTGTKEMIKEGFSHPLKQVYRVTIRTMDKYGRLLLVPDEEVEVYWTSLDADPEHIIELYHGHGTSEQFHSELKTDMDLERLPAGKFATNDLILHAGLFAYNLLRLMGQEILGIPGFPLRKKATRLYERSAMLGRRGKESKNMGKGGEPPSRGLYVTKYGYYMIDDRTCIRKRIPRRVFLSVPKSC